MAELALVLPPALCAMTDQNDHYTVQTSVHIRT